MVSGYACLHQTSDPMTTIASKGLCFSLSGGQSHCWIDVCCRMWVVALLYIWGPILLLGWCVLQTVSGWACITHLTVRLMCAAEGEWLYVLYCSPPEGLSCFRVDVCSSMWVAVLICILWAHLTLGWMCATGCKVLCFSAYVGPPDLWLDVCYRWSVAVPLHPQTHLTSCWMCAADCEWMYFHAHRGSYQFWLDVWHWYSV